VIAGIGGGGRVVVTGNGAVHLAENGDRAAIVDLVKKSRAMCLDRPQENEGTLEPDAATGIARCRLEIDDAAIGSGLRIKNELGYAANLFVAACRTKADARRKRRAFEYFNADDCGRCRTYGRESCQHQCR
jgi:hypothetical protein